MSDSSVEKSSSSQVHVPDAYELLHDYYNPAALSHLRQPVPNDLPAHLDASVFTFQDALEDLMAVSQGRTLPDIESCHQRSKMLRQMYPGGEPTWLWIRRLQSQGLIRQTSSSLFFPGSALQPIWEDILRDFGQGADRAKHGRVRDVDESLTGMDKLLWEIHKHFPGVKGNENPPTAGEKDKNNDPADNFDELYKAIRSSFADDKGAWQALKNAINKGEERPGNDYKQHQTNANNSPPTTSTKNDLKNKRTSETRSEYVDECGYRHVTIESKLYDENGEEIGSSTVVTVTPTEQSDSKSVGNGSDNSNNPNTKSKGGWFW